ncbi:MAG TPA: HAMP domain-containing sensor histidine kinase, partial [Labilithrix sp.]|nr:HAMP domain-containing sensor histidine kinase [Labilithrix sp.]
MVSDTMTRSAVLPLLADAIERHVGAGGVCVVEIGRAGGARIAVARGLPAATESIVLDPDAMGEELGRAVNQACGSAFAAVETRPIVASGNLFGAVVMLFRQAPPTDDLLKVAEGFVDLAAIALDEAAQFEKLERSYADLRVSHEALAKTEKLRALGQMAAGISHDLKNILNPLSLHLQVVDRAILRGDSEEARESVREMKQVVLRGVETVERLRAYSRQNKESKAEPVELDRLAREAVGIAKPRMAATGHVLRVVEELGAPRRVLADGTELLSAVVNLVVNAIDAAGTVGKIITLRSGETDGGSYIEVEDDGPGMAPDVEQRVF